MIFVILGPWIESQSKRVAAKGNIFIILPWFYISLSSKCGWNIQNRTGTLMYIPGEVPLPISVREIGVTQCL